MWKTSVVVAPADFANAPAPLKGAHSDTIKIAAELGYDAVQFTVNRPREFELDVALKALSDNQIAASGIATGTGYSMDGICLGHRAEDVRLAAVQRMKEHIDLATQLGQADVVIGLIRGKYADGGTRENYMRQYRKSIADCLAYAERHSIRLVHEAIGRTDSDVLKTIDDNITFIDSFRSPCLKLHIDSHHMNLEEVNFSAAIVRAGDLISQVDISDVGRSIPDGKNFDFSELMVALKAVSYARYLVFEFNANGLDRAAAQQALQFCKSLEATVCAPQTLRTVHVLDSK